MAIVSYIIADRQLAQNIVELQNPQSNELIQLRAITKGASPGDSIVWKYMGTPPGCAIFYNADEVPPKTPFADTITTTVGTDLTSTVWVGGPEQVIITILASWGAAPQHSKTGKLVVAQQTLAFCSFGEGGDAPAPNLPNAVGGTVKIPTDTGGSAYPPDQYAESYTYVGGLTQPGYYVGLLSTGDPSDNPTYEAVGAINDFDAQNIDFFLPYYRLQSGIGSTNNLGYFIYTQGWAKKLSQVFTFPASGTAFVRPDDQNFPPADGLDSPLYLEPDSQGEDGFANGIVADTIPPLLTQFDRQGILNFAIPAYEGLQDDDRISVTIYLDAWQHNSNKLNSYSLTVGNDPKRPYTGKMFTTGFGPAKYGTQKFLRAQFPGSKIFDLCPYQGSRNYGYGWVQYVAFTSSGTYYSPSLYTHINFCDD